MAPASRWKVLLAEDGKDQITVGVRKITIGDVERCGFLLTKLGSAATIGQVQSGQTYAQDAVEHWLWGDV